MTAIDPKFLGRALALVAVLSAGLVFMPDTGNAQPSSQMSNNCPGERVDGSTAADAQRKAQKAGYAKVTGLRKGCDSVWHGKAMKDGVEVSIMIPPSGEVARETD